MARITINILRNDIYVIAEGISVMISQHNGGTPTCEQLWASPEESKKLDIYYREAVSDLERRLTEWIQQTSGQYNLTQEGGDYTLTLAMSPHWPVNMQGLLANKIQDYLVHAVTAGWLNDFDGLTIKQDYQAMSAQDITDIRGIIYLRAFNFRESERSDDGTTKDDSTALTPSERSDDGTTKDDSTALTPSERSDDGTTKDDSTVLTPSERQSDTDKEGPLFKPEAGYRRKDNVIKQDFERRKCPPDNLRHRDNAVVEHFSDYTDWSGAEIEPQAELLRHDAHRIQHGRGYTPSPLDRRRAKPAPHPPIPPKPHHKDPRIPDFPDHPNYPPIYADGKGWSDEPLYDAEGSEHFINGKCHK